MKDKIAPILTLSISILLQSCFSDSDSGRTLQSSEQYSDMSELDDITIVDDSKFDVSSDAEVRRFLTSKTFRQENMSIRFYPEGHFDLSRDYSTVLTGSWRLSHQVYDTSIMLRLESSGGDLDLMLSSDGKLTDKATFRIFE